MLYSQGHLPEASVFLDEPASPGQVTPLHVGRGARPDSKPADCQEAVHRPGHQQKRDPGEARAEEVEESHEGRGWPDTVWQEDLPAL